MSSVKDANRHYKAALEKRKEADKKEDEKRLVRKRKQMIKEIEEKKRLLLVNSQNQLRDMQAEIDRVKMTNTN